ncbi:glycoside hydrolase family 105 protein [Bacteroidota bacterium]
MKNAKSPKLIFLFHKNTVLFLMFAILAGLTTVSCKQNEPADVKSPEAAVEDYQNRTPEQLLELVALRQIKEIKAGEYKHGTWDSVLNSAPSVGPWFGYPMGVTLTGLQYSNRILNNPAITEYVRDYIKIATDDYAYSVWQRKTFGQIYKKGGSFSRLIRMNMLDDCGAASAAMLEAIFNDVADVTTNLTEYLNNAGYFITETHWRLEDGSFWRPVSPGSRPLSMWADDLYMSCPFLIRWAEFKDEPKYLDDAVLQIINFSTYLQDKDGVWFHAYLVDEDRPAEFKWGRANGWVMLATAEVLSAMPEDHPRREELLAVFRKHIEGLKSHQSESGLWYQVIDHPELNWGVETSCTAMFTYAISRAINRGWIDKSNIEVVRKAVNGLNRKVEADGTILGVCRSASIGPDLKYYEDRPTQPDDQHGWGATLMALSEYLIAEQNQ